MSKEIENNLAQIKENSGIKSKEGSLSEASTSSDVASTLQLVSKIIDEKYNYSLGYQICEVQPLKSTFGKTFAVRRNGTSADFEVVSTDIHPKLYKISTSFTQEVFQDMQKMLGKNATDSSASVLGGLSALEENNTILNFIADNADTKPTLTISDDTNFEIIIQEIGKRVSESVIEMNYSPYHTLNSFCILPPKYAAAILGSYSFMTEDFSGKTENERSLFVGKIGRTEYYINPFLSERNQFTDDYNNDYGNEDFDINDPQNDYIYVGLKSGIPGKSSLIFAPYMYELQNVIDPQTVENNLFLYNRYGLIANPLHVPVQGKAMLHKFQIIGTP